MNPLAMGCFTTENIYKSVKERKREREKESDKKKRECLIVLGKILLFLN
jgi:hypothetical protein